MKKGLLLCVICVSFIFGADVALAETVFFPYWQHGWSCQTFFSIINTNPEEQASITLYLLDDTGWLITSALCLLGPGDAWLPDTEGPWYTDGDHNGFGYFEIDWLGADPSDSIYLWGCVYANLTGIGMGQPGFTLVLPQNPYGGN